MGLSCCKSEVCQNDNLVTGVMKEKEASLATQLASEASLANQVKSIAVHNLKEIGKTKGGLAVPMNNETNNLLADPSANRVDSLFRAITNFKIEPKHFRVERKKEMLSEKYEIGGVIGRGTFGEVKKIKDKTTGELRAVKIISKTHCQQTDNFADEIDIIKKLDHPNVVRFYGFYQDELYYYLITEYYHSDQVYIIGIVKEVIC